MTVVLRVTPQETLDAADVPQMCPKGSGMEKCTDYILLLCFVFEKV